MITYTPYQQRIRQCFAEAYTFLDTNKHVRSDSDWERIAGSLVLYTDPLTQDLITAAVNELEREYKEHEKEHIPAAN